MSALLDKMTEHALQQPDAPAVIANGYTLNYRDLVKTVLDVAAELRARRYQRLAIYGSNDIDWAVLDLAAGAANIPVVPVPLFFSTAQREHLFADSGIDAVYCGQGVLSLNGTVEVSSILPGVYRRLPHRAAVSDVPFSKITYTSGSTGAPKGACLAEDTITSIVSSLADRLAPNNLGRHLCLLPFATLLENIAGIYLPLWMGRTLVLGDTERLGLLSNHTFEPRLFCDAIARYDIQSVILLPQMLKSIVEYGDIPNLTSLRFIAVGGGKVSPALLERAIVSGLPVYEGYGLTECGSCVALNTPGNAKLGSVGRPLPHANVSIDEAGEVWVTGAAMTGYLNDSLSTGKIATGDAGYIDEDGYLYITGRIKNTIISSFGRNISPEWVEGIFLASPLIQAVAVFGEAEPSLSAVILPSSDLTDRELASVIKKINAELPDYARVMRWTRALAPFSYEDGTLTANGKLCRSKIAQAYGKKIAALEGVTL
jgi:long-subunit acyl-CoA synthetase (AMP-forming)